MATTPSPREVVCLSVCQEGGVNPPRAAPHLPAGLRVSDWAGEARSGLADAFLLTTLGREEVRKKKAVTRHYHP